MIRFARQLLFAAALVLFSLYYNELPVLAGQPACAYDSLSDCDSDGIINKVDKCPFDKDLKSADGKPLDFDSDGIPDACDKCPKAYDQKVINKQTGEAWQPDQDGDGVPNACDNCPTIANADQANGDDNWAGDACQCVESEGDPFKSGPKDFCTGETLSEYSCYKNQPATILIDCTKYNSEFQTVTCVTDKCVAKNIPPQKKPDPADGDWDKDGIPNKKDNCPFKFNPDQADKDGDGVGDSCDGDISDKGGLPGSSKGDGSPSGGAGGKGESCDKSDSSNNSVALKTISTLDLYAVAAAGADKLWVAGDGGNVFVREGGGEWKGMPSPWDIFPDTIKLPQSARAITALWNPDGSSLVAATKSGHVFIYSNGAWSPLGPDGQGDMSSFDASVYSIHGNSADDFWIGGDSGLLWHFSDDGWMSAAVEVAASYDQEDARGRPRSPYRGFDVGATLSGWNKASAATIRSVFVLPDQSLWIVGDKGVIVRKTGKKWEDLSLQPSVDLRTVWADAKTVYVGGSDGKIWCRAADKWEVCHTATGNGMSPVILGIAGPSADHLYAVGSGGLFLQKTSADPKGQWQSITLPFPNSVTSVWANENFALAGGINGTVYTLGKSGLKTAFIERAAVKHPEWTATRWTTLRGKINGSGKIEGDLALAGDDMAVAVANADLKWQLVYSDSSVVPFASGYHTKRDIRDMAAMKSGDKLSFFAVGNFDHIIAGETTLPLGSAVPVWKGVPFVAPVKKVQLGTGPVGLGETAQVVSKWETLFPAPKKELQMQSIRPGSAGMFIAAGSEGVFSYDTATGNIEKLLANETPGRAVAVGKEDKLYGALNDSLRVSDDAKSWQSMPWAAVAPKLSPEDAACSAVSVHVVGTKEYGAYTGITSLWKFFWQEPESYYLTWNGKVWSKVTMPNVSDKPTSPLRLRPLAETVDSIPLADPIMVEGVVMMGRDGLVALVTNGNFVQFYDKQNQTPEDWYDGTYGYHTDWLWGWNEITGVLDVYVLGAGGHNAFTKFHYHHECEMDLL